MSAQFPLPLFASTLSDPASRSENLGNPLLGLVIVLTALALLALAIKLAAARRRACSERPETLALNPEPAADPAPGTVPPQILAVIAAAVDTVLQGRGRILSIHEHPHPEHGSLDPKLQAWSVEGRRQIFSSHQVR